MVVFSLCGLGIFCQLGGSTHQKHQETGRVGLSHRNKSNKPFREQSAEHGLNILSTKSFIPVIYQLKIYKQLFRSMTRNFHEQLHYSSEDQFERFRGFLELISRFEFEFRRCDIFFNDSNFWCVQSSITHNVAVNVHVLWPVCSHTIPFRMLCP